MSNTHMYTMRELNQHTADVMRAINDTGEPALITRHGRFVALITPLANVQVESAILSAVVQELNEGAGETEEGAAYSSAEVAHELDLNVKPAPPRELHEPGAAPRDHLVTVTLRNEDGDPVIVDAGDLTPETRKYLHLVAKRLSTREIADLVRELKH